jgi:uncharacterized RDD family membrane protein YckC
MILLAMAGAGTLPNFATMKLAGDGTRTLNFLVDTAIIFGVALLLNRIWQWYVAYWDYTPLNFGWFFFGFLFLYYFAWESLYSRTPGKWVSLTRVVNLKGMRPTIGQFFIRSLVRIFIPDLFFLPFLGCTLHDYLSKTRVVQA